MATDEEINELAYLLDDIREADTDYERREGLVYILLSWARSAGWKVGFLFDPNEPEWPVAMVEIPGFGQVSWHMPQYPDPWDGHSTDEKYGRIADFVACVPRRKD